MGGAPGTGKTTLARRLAADLRLAIVTKDDVKETLADALGSGDRERSRELGAAAFAVMFAVARRTLDSGAGIVLEANFHRGASDGELRELARHADASVVVCRTDEATRRARFTDRGARGERHAVHLDAEILAREWPGDDATFAIDIGVRHLDVDTHDGYAPDLAAIAAFARGG